MTGRFAPHALLLAMMAIWGLSYVVVKHALGALSPFALVMVRYWLAAVCLLPLLARRRALGELRRTALPGAGAGVLLAVGYLLQTAGMRETSASMGGFLAGLIPLLVALGGWLFLRGRLGAVGVVGLALGFAGMGCLVWPAGGPAAGTDSTRGILLQVASSTSFAAHVLLLSRIGGALPTLAFCLWQILVTALAGTAAFALDGGFAAGLPSWPWPPLLSLDLLYLGAVATALGITVQARVQPRILPLHVALLFATQPLFAALAGWLVLGDAMRDTQLAGGVLVVLGIVVTSLDRGGAAAAVKPRAGAAAG